MNKKYQICSKTVMDTSDSDIVFDAKGVSNHVNNYMRDEKNNVLTGKEGEEKLRSVANIIRSYGKGKKYDCILGLSGGVDSTYLCLLAKQLNLRPLIVHFDNGWNSELAVFNIEKTVKHCGFDLYTYVVDWPEFRDLQRSYFKSNVIDIEVLTDHGFMAVLYQQARQHKIKYVLGGMNVVTESILPRNWIYEKSDLQNILGIQETYGNIPINKFKSYPMLSPLRRKFYDRILGLEVISPLNWIDFKYAKVKAEITESMGWRDYGGKHFESIFTRFYQGYILPNKFHIDKRRAHLSSLICSGQMTREEALKILESSGYDLDQCKIDRRFVLKKLGFSEEEFEAYMNAPRVEHTKFGTTKSLYENYPILKPLRPLVNLVYPN